MRLLTSFFIVLILILPAYATSRQADFVNGLLFYWIFLDKKETTIKTPSQATPKEPDYCDLAEKHSLDTEAKTVKFFLDSLNSETFEQWEELKDGVENHPVPTDKEVRGIVTANAVEYYRFCNEQWPELRGGVKP